MPMEPVGVEAHQAGMSPNIFAGHHHVKLLGRTNQLHGGVINQHVAEFNIRIVLAHLDHHITPQVASFASTFILSTERQLFLVRLLGSLEGDVPNTTDFRLTIHHGIEANTLAIFFTHTTRLTK